MNVTLEPACSYEESRRVLEWGLSTPQSVVTVKKSVVEISDVIDIKLNIAFMRTIKVWTKIMRSPYESWKIVSFSS